MQFALQHGYLLSIVKQGFARKCIEQVDHLGTGSVSLALSGSNKLLFPHEQLTQAIRVK